MADYASVLTGGTNSFPTTSEHLNALATDILSEGVVGAVGNTAGVAPATGGLACNAQGTPNMTVAVTAGYCYVTTTPSGQASQLLRANIAAQNATIAANATGGTRYDWIYVAMSAANAANPAVAGDNVASITVSRSTSSSTDNGTPPTYGYPIAVVTVANGASSITNGNIADVRESVEVTNNATSTGWTNLGSTPDTVTNDGQRSYTLTFSGIDVTDNLYPGTRLKLTRTVTAPTQCTDLEASSSQYYNDTSVSGMTFTDDFACSAWVKIESYGAPMTIASRYNGTSGWYFLINAYGQVQMDGFNAGSTNYSNVSSGVAIPIGRWVHVAAQLDMSTFTATTTTSYTMIDGQNVSARVTRGGTNPTALIQAGNLQIGANNGTAYPFDGKLAQVAIYGAKVTQATMRASMNQALTGSETSLVSAYSFNNSITDLNTSNANNLTAQNSAVATATDSPFAQRSILATAITAGTTDYGIVTSGSFSTDSTVTVFVPEGSTIPTSGGVATVSYSYEKTPYGFPSETPKWTIWYTHRSQLSQAGPVAGTWYNAFTNGNLEITVPVGGWTLEYNTTVYNGHSGGACDVYTTLSTANNSESDLETTSRVATNGTNGAMGGVYKSKTYNVSVATVYYLNLKCGAGTGSSIYFLTDQAGCSLLAKCNYI